MRASFKSKPVFFTLPPPSIAHEYIIFSPLSETDGIRYLKKHKRVIKEIMIDAGVRIFERGAKEYPGGPLKVFRKQLIIARRARTIVPNARIYVVIPDYPADYPNNIIENNTEKTLRVINTIREKYGTVNNTATLVAVVQAKSIWDDPQLQTLKQALEQYKAEGIFNDFTYIALGTVCTIAQLRLKKIPIRKAIKWINSSVKLVRRYTITRLHVFGLWIKALLAIYDMIDSFDSSAWTRPISRKKLQANYSAKNMRQRVLFFQTWKQKANYILAQSKLTHFF